MVEIVNADILDFEHHPEVDIVVHQVNCKSVMGAGLAKQIRSRYPEAFKLYKEWCDMMVDVYKNSKIMLGTAQRIKCHDGRYIENVFGQDGYGRDKQYTAYWALKRGLEQVAEKSIKENQFVAIPYGIGCGLAGGDWNEVYRIINEVFGDYDRVKIYKLT